MDAQDKQKLLYGELDKDYLKQLDDVTLAELILNGTHIFDAEIQSGPESSELTMDQKEGLHNNLLKLRDEKLRRVGAEVLDFKVHKGFDNVVFNN